MIRVFVGYGASFAPDSVQIAIVNDFPGDAGNSPARMIAHFGEDNALTWEVVEPLTIMKPSLMLTDDMARAVMEELTRHYHGADDSRALRRDYDAERKRVDKLTDAVSGLAASLAHRPVELRCPEAPR